MTLDDHARPSAAPTGRQLLREAWRHLKTVPGVAALPVLGGVAGTVLFLLFAGPGIVAGVVAVPDDHTRTIVLTIAAIVGAVAATLAVTYFQGAVVSAALQQAAGEPTSVGQALGGANRRFGRLLQWGFVVASVNVVLSLIRDRNNVFTSILSAAGGLAWSAATFLALPAVVSEGIGPIAAVKRSATLLKTTWGSAVRVTLRFGLILLPAILVAILLVFVGAITMGAVNEVAGVCIMVLGVLVLVCALAFLSTIKAYVTTQLYLYASGRPTALPAELVRGAVRTA
ncbi:DUF6159 family protein [Microbacterium resistens]|uniref:DUF6159 family protein n=1 Tax=Microbacterium resistens TaxID=156977 RepID=A0ABY3RP80_9MICO|nr:DUF6159 family protein [Microbacterium resistens]UGS25818.1 DUF6159 family protein [Microbacterium resistens]